MHQLAVGTSPVKSSTALGSSARSRYYDWYRASPEYHMTVSRTLCGPRYFILYYSDTDFTAQHQTVSGGKFI